jgi:YbbR domain-containing protein
MELKMESKFPENFYSNLIAIAKIIFSRTYIELKKSPGLLLLSLIISSALWIFVTDTENPQITDTFPVSIVVQPVNVGSELAVANTIDKINIRVSAPQNKWENLQSNNFYAFVDLNGLGARQQNVAVRIDVNGIRGVKIIEVIPSKVNINLENLVEKQVSIDFRAIGSPPLGYKLGKITPKSNITDISGPESLIQLVKSVIADINVTGLTVSLEQSYNLTPRGTGGGEIQGVTVNPESVFFDIEVNQTNYTKTIPVEISLTGEPKYGYKISGIEVSPAFVKLNGSINELQNVNSILLKPININSQAISFSDQIDLPISPYYSIINDNYVKVTLTIVPIFGSVRTTVIPEFINKKNRKVKFNDDFDFISLNLRGALDDINNLKFNEIKIPIDISEFELGKHTVRPNIKLPETFSLISSIPMEFDINIYE